MAAPAPLLPLVLSVKAANWRMNDDTSAEADSEFQHVRRRALQRDDYTCRFCGFKAPKWQEVHHLNDDHSDNRLPNLVTACIFCHMCQHIGLAGRHREATLVWIPEIPQDRLNHLVRTILVVKRWGDEAGKRREAPQVMEIAQRMASAGKAMEAKLREREADAERLFKTHDPVELANALLAMPDSLYEKRAGFLAGLRLLPLGHRDQGGTDKMPDIIDCWLGSGGSYGPLPPNSWIGILRQNSILV